MAYNSYFPAGYAPQYYSMPQVQQPQQQSSNGIIWVQGEAGAKSYLVAPNTTVQLWDSEAQVIYLKSADASGMPSMKIIDYTIRNNNPLPQQAQQAEPAISYVTKEEFDNFKSEVSKMIGGIENERTISATTADEKRNVRKS